MMTFENAAKLDAAIATYKAAWRHPFAARRRAATSPGDTRSEAATAPARPHRAGATITTRQDALNVIATGLLPMYGETETRRILTLAALWPLEVPA